MCDSVCELHVHSDCAPFVCSDCRLCHQDGGQDYVSIAAHHVSTMQLSFPPSSNQNQNHLISLAVSPNLLTSDPMPGHAPTPLAGGEHGVWSALRGVPACLRLLRRPLRDEVRVVWHHGKLSHGSTIYTSTIVSIISIIDIIAWSLFVAVVSNSSAFPPTFSLSRCYLNRFWSLKYLLEKMGHRLLPLMAS